MGAETDDSFITEHAPKDEPKFKIYGVHFDTNDKLSHFSAVIHNYSAERKRAHMESII